MKCPIIPEHVSEEIIENLKPLPKCIHGNIHNLCTICNKEFYYPEIFKQ